ncbi:MAG: serine/threonine protein kinase [Xanthomonadales bacterium]|jgi:serine/threonine-protein kinase|nr:serine/threonine protein kinase [Xanthomonadales bacterium]
MGSPAVSENVALLGRLSTAVPIGRGSSGEVYRAHDPVRGVDVALKVVPCATPEWRARAQREAELQARIRHPDIAQVYGWGERDGEFCLVMQYIEGESLDAACRHLPLAAIAGLLARVCRAVHAAHQQGLLHRDLKPANVKVARDPDGSLHPYVLDFGLARDLGAEGLTETGALLGTPAYMSPEQARGEHSTLTVRSDVYSLGVIACALFTGAPPLAGSSGAALVLAVASGAARTESPAWRQLPLGLRAIIRCAMEPAPGGRYASAAALAEDLERWQRGERPRALRAHAWRSLRAALRRHPRSVAAVLLLLIGVLLVSIGQLRERASAEASARFAAAAAELETRVRIAHLLPEHSLDPLHRAQRLQLEALEREAAGLGEVARRHAEPALVRALLALDDPAGAEAAAERVAAAGLRGPTHAFDRARAGLRLYRRELLRALESPDATLAAARLDRARRQYAEPARQALREAAALGGTEARIAEALGLWLDGEPEAGLARLAELPPDAGLEAELLRAELLGDLAQQALRGRADQAAEQRVVVALQAADAAVVVLRSSPDAHRARCRARMLALRVALVSPGELESPTDACTALTRLLPGQAASWSAAISEAALESNIARQRGRDDGPALARAAALIAAARQADVDPQGLVAAQVQVLISKVQRDADLGRNPAPLLTEAEALLQPGAASADFDQLAIRHQLDLVTALYGDPAERRAAAARTVATAERLVALSPEVPSLHNRLGSALDTLAFEQLQAGLDPADHATRAIQHHRRARELDPRGLVNLGNLGLALWTAADVAMWRGEDPAPWLEASVEATEAALAIDPTRLNQWNNLASALTVWADWTLHLGADPRALLRRAREAREHQIELAAGRMPMPCDLARITLLEARVERDDARLQAALDGALGGIGEVPTSCSVVVASAWQEALQRGQTLQPERLRWLAGLTAGQRSEELRLRLLLLDAEVCGLACTDILPDCRPASGSDARSADCFITEVEQSLARHRHLRWKLGFAAQ